MIIDKVTITGADDKVDCTDLYRLQNIFPFVEWGILFSKSKVGQPRYPSLDWMRFNLMTKHLNLSAHFCGWWSRMVMEHAALNLLEDAKEMGFTRIQMNYNFMQAGDYSFAPLVDWLESNSDMAIIFQYNKANQSALSGRLAVKSLPDNLHVLYDSSGGRGTAIDIEGKNPFHGHYTGYSGGINPTNVQSLCQQIIDGEFRDKVWIDMESGVRTNIEFDLKKVEEVLDRVNNLVNLY